MVVYKNSEKRGIFEMNYHESWYDCILNFYFIEI